jgi:putative transposase
MADTSVNPDNPIMDLATRQIVGWAMDCHMPWTLVARALVMALQRRNPPPGLIHHCDYQSHDAEAFAA